MKSAQSSNLHTLAPACVNSPKRFRPLPTCVNDPKLCPKLYHMRSQGAVPRAVPAPTVPRLDDPASAAPQFPGAQRVANVWGISIKSELCSLWPIPPAHGHKLLPRSIVPHGGFARGGCKDVLFCTARKTVIFAKKG